VTEVLKFGLLGSEDIRKGTGSFEAELADGRTVTLTELNLSDMVVDALTLAQLQALTPTAGGFYRVTDDIRGPWLANGTAWNHMIGRIIDVRRDFAAVGDDATDDTTVIQAALNAVPAAGGTVYFPPGFTYLVSSANITLKANTTLWIPVGATLHLSTRRLTANNVNNITIFGGGLIKSTALNQTDGLISGTNVGGRGIVEFIGTNATSAERFIMIGMEVEGDFSGTPDGTSAANSQRKGVLVGQCRHVKVIGNVIHGIWDEALYYAGASADRDVLFSENTVHTYNFNGINFNAGSSNNLTIRDNTLHNGWNGIEMAMGSAIGNTIDVMGNAGIFTGAGGGKGPILIADNTITAVDGSAIDVTFDLAGSRIGPIKITGNTLDDVEEHGINVNHVTDLVVTDNAVSRAGNQATGSFSGIVVGNVTRGWIAGNSITNPGTSAVIGLQIATTSTGLEFGSNHVDPHTTTISGPDSNVGIRPSYKPTWTSSSIGAVTGTTSETDIRSLTIPGNSLGANGGMHILAVGSVTGTAGTKTIRLKFGSATVSAVSEAAGATANWRIEVWIFNSASASSQKGNVLSHEGTAIEEQNRFGASVDTTVDFFVKLTGQLADGTDSITTDFFLVEPMWSIRATD
jgi:hypothetical protein